MGILSAGMLVLSYVRMSLMVPAVWTKHSLKRPWVVGQRCMPHVEPSWLCRLQRTVGRWWCSSAGAMLDNHPGTAAHRPT